MLNQEGKGKGNENFDRKKGGEFEKSEGKFDRKNKWGF